MIATSSSLPIKKNCCDQLAEQNFEGGSYIFLTLLPVSWTATVVTSVNLLSPVQPRARLSTRIQPLIRGNRRARILASKFCSAFCIKSCTTDLMQRIGHRQCRCPISVADLDRNQFFFADPKKNCCDQLAEQNFEGGSYIFLTLLPVSWTATVVTSVNLLSPVQPRARLSTRIQPLIRGNRRARILASKFCSAFCIKSCTTDLMQRIGHRQCRCPISVADLDRNQFFFADPRRTVAIN